MSSALSRSGRVLQLPTASWCGDRLVELPIPSGWEVTEYRGLESPAVSPAALREGLQVPLDGPALREVLAPDRSVAILIDDHSRPTPVEEPLRLLLNAIREAGVPASRTKIVVAIGTHLLGDERLMRRKLGDIADAGIEIVLNECANRRSLRHCGVLASGHPIMVNSVFADADVRVTMSGVYPHDDVGYSGGAKILMGAFGLATLSALHRTHGSVGRGQAMDTPFRLELEAIADRIGLDYSINLVLNSRKEVAAIVSGRHRTAFRRAAEFVAHHAAVRVGSGDFDVVVSNAYPFDASVSVLGKSYWPFAACGNPRFQIVMTSLCERGGGRLPWAVSRGEQWVQRAKAVLGLTAAKKAYRRWWGARAADPRRIIFAPPGPEMVVGSYVAGLPVFTSWEHIVRVIEERSALDRPRVAVFPWSPLLYPRSE